MDAIDILLVEDSPGDIRLTQEALKEAKVRNRLAIVTDGEAALRYLFRQEEFKDVTRPDLVILDLNLPGRDGREVLDRIKSDPDLRRVPVVVLTTSSDQRDIHGSYDLHANCFITKPVDMNSFVEVVRNIDSFWFTIVKLPGD